MRPADCLASCLFANDGSRFLLAHQWLKYIKSGYPFSATLLICDSAVGKVVNIIL